MAPKSCAYQSPCVNPLTDPAKEQNEHADAQGPAKGSNVGSNEAPTLPETPTPTLVSPLAKDLFTKFIKVLIETT